MNLIKTILYTWLASKAMPGGPNTPPGRGPRRKGCCGGLAVVGGLLLLLIVAWAVTSGGR